MIKTALGLFFGDENERKETEGIRNYAGEELEEGYGKIDPKIKEEGIIPTVYNSYYIGNSTSLSHGGIWIEKGLSSVVLVPWDSYLKRFNDIMAYKIKEGTVTTAKSDVRPDPELMVGPSTDVSMMALYRLQSIARGDKESIIEAKSKGIFTRDQCAKWKDAAKFMGFRRVVPISVDVFNIFSGFHCNFLQDLLWERFIDTWLYTPRDYGFIFSYSNGNPFLAFELFLQSIITEPIRTDIMYHTPEGKAFTPSDFHRDAFITVESTSKTPGSSSKNEKGKAIAEGIPSKKMVDLVHFDSTLQCMKNMRDKYLPHIAVLNHSIDNVLGAVSIVLSDYSAERKYSSADTITVNRDKMDRLVEAMKKFEISYSSILEHSLLKAQTGRE